MCCGKYKANLDYGNIEMDEQNHDVWFDVRMGYNLDKFVGDMASKIIWGRSQTIAVWAVDRDSAVEWKLRRNEHLEHMIQDRLDVKVANLVVEVVEKEDYNNAKSQSSVGSKATSCVTSKEPVCPSAYGEGGEDTSTSPDQVEHAEYVVDWSTLTNIPEEDADGDPNILVDEDKIYEAMGFKAADDRAEQESSKEVPIPVIPIELQLDMMDAAVEVDDRANAELVMDWDRDNPDMSVGTFFPCMYDFRQAVRQHAMMNEFEVGTEKSDKVRFRGYCKAAGCPWIIRARTQADNSVRVHILTTFCFHLNYLFEV